MKQFVRAIMVGLMLITLPGIVFASGSSDACKTKYPVILAHGMAAATEILGMVDYWWGIEGALENQGAKVYTTTVNAMDGTFAKAEAWRAQFLEILAVTGTAKANVIGHSHGAIYTRHAITNMGLSGKVASLTSLSGPHRGSAIADVIMEDMPDWLVNAGTTVVDFVYGFVFGDTNPNSFENGIYLTRNYMKTVFNPNTPDMPGVYYQSWAAKAKWGCPSVVLEPLWLVMLAYEGDNDGVVSVASAKWGNFRGVKDAAWYSPGVDHINMVGHLFGVTPGFDAPGFYTEIVSDLKKRGY